MVQTFDELGPSIASVQSVQTSDQTQGSSAYNLAAEPFAPGNNSGLADHEILTRKPTARAADNIDLTTQNNFDLIRLFAAAQVMCGHVLWHVGHAQGWLPYVVGLLPGVPVFFFTSGFLISGTYERNPELWSYLRNRILRIYPALWASCLLTLLLITLLYTKPIEIPVLGWSLMQSTIFQDWNPPFLRGYGIGVANGSLWTIPVELSFYAATPIIYKFVNKNLDIFLCILAVSSFALLQGLTYLSTGFFQKAALLTPFPWIGMFLCGILARRNLQKLEIFVAGTFGCWIVIFAIMVIMSNYIHAPLLFRSEINAVGLLYFLCMAGLVLSAACSWPQLSNNILKRNDISYGLYLYHMPIINALVHLRIQSLVLPIVLTLVAAGASWRWIERPALRLKRSIRGRRSARLDLGEAVGTTQVSSVVRADDNHLAPQSFNTIL